MAANDGQVFISAEDQTTGHFHIWAVPKQGGAPQVLHDDAQVISGLAVTGDRLIYAAGTNVNRIGAGGGAETLVSTAKAGGRSLTVVGDSIYWAVDGLVAPWDGGVFTVAAKGGASTTLAGAIRARGLRIAGDVLYAIAADTPDQPNGQFLHIDLTMGRATRLGAGINFAGTKDLVGVDSRLFVLGSDRVYELDPGSGSMTALYTDNLDEGTNSIVAAGQQLYWTYEGQWPGRANIRSGRVRRYDVSSRHLSDIAVCLPKPGPLAVDAQYVYWLNWLSGEVLRVPR